MSSRGILQLQRLKVSFCDWSGSSNGIRNFFKSDKFYNHVNGNPSIAFEFHLRSYQYYENHIRSLFQYP